MTRWRPSLSRNDDSKRRTKGQTAGWGWFRLWRAVMERASSSRLWHCPLVWPWASHLSRRNGDSNHYPFFLRCLDFKKNWQRKTRLKHLRNLLLLLRKLLLLHDGCAAQGACSGRTRNSAKQQTRCFYYSDLWNNIIYLLNVTVELPRYELYRMISHWHRKLPFYVSPRKLLWHWMNRHLLWRGMNSAVCCLWTESLCGALFCTKFNAKYHPHICLNSTQASKCLLAPSKYILQNQNNTHKAKTEGKRLRWDTGEGRIERKLLFAGKQTLDPTIWIGLSDPGIFLLKHLTIVSHIYQHKKHQVCTLTHGWDTFLLSHRCVVYYRYAIGVDWRGGKK